MLCYDWCYFVFKAYNKLVASVSIPYNCRVERISKVQKCMMYKHPKINSVRHPLQHDSLTSVVVYKTHCLVYIEPLSAELIWEKHRNQMFFFNLKSSVTALCSDGPLFRRSYVQKVLCSEGPLFRRSYVQKVLCSEGSIFRRFYVQKVLCSEIFVQKIVCLESTGDYLSVPIGHPTLNQRQ